MLETLTTQLAAAKHLSVEQVRRVVESLTDEIIAASAKAEFLIALATKGETPEEIAAFAAVLRSQFAGSAKLEKSAAADCGKKETPAPVCRKRPRKEFRGQRSHSGLFAPKIQA